MNYKNILFCNFLISLLSLTIPLWPMEGMDLTQSCLFGSGDFKKGDFSVIELQSETISTKKEQKLLPIQEEAKLIFKINQSIDSLQTVLSSNNKVANLPDMIREVNNNVVKLQGVIQKEPGFHYTRNAILNACLLSNDITMDELNQFKEKVGSVWYLTNKMLDSNNLETSAMLFNQKRMKEIEEGLLWPDDVQGQTMYIQHLPIDTSIKIYILQLMWWSAIGKKSSKNLGSSLCLDKEGTKKQIRAASFDALRNLGGTPPFMRENGGIRKPIFSYVSICNNQLQEHARRLSNLNKKSAFSSFLIFFNGLQEFRAKTTPQEAKTITKAKKPKENKSESVGQTNSPQSPKKLSLVEEHRAKKENEKRKVLECIQYAKGFSVNQEGVAGTYDTLSYPFAKDYIEVVHSIAFDLRYGNFSDEERQDVLRQLSRAEHKDLVGKCSDNPNRLKLQAACNILQDIDGSGDAWISDERKKERKDIESTVHQNFHYYTENYLEKIQAAYPRENDDKKDRERIIARYKKQLSSMVTMYIQEHKKINPNYKETTSLSEDIYTNYCDKRQGYLESLKSEAEKVKKTTGLFTTIWNYFSNKKIVETFERVKKNNLISLEASNLEINIKSYQQKGWLTSMFESLQWLWSFIF